MLLKPEFVRYTRGSNSEVLRQPAQLIKVKDLNTNFARGSLFLIQGLTFVPKLQTYKDELFVLSHGEGSANLIWLNYYGYHTGSRTLLDFHLDPKNPQLSAEVFRSELQAFYQNISECRFDLNKVFYVDGWLEFDVQG